MTKEAAYAEYAAAVRADADEHGTIAHCDSRILHAVGECKYCDSRPSLHAARKQLLITYTGHRPPAGYHPCPAHDARPELDPESCWTGNMRGTPELAAALQRQAEEMKTLIGSLHVE